MSGKSNDQYSEKETERRLRAALHGAFNTPAKPLKDVPRKRAAQPAAAKKKPAK